MQSLRCLAFAAVSVFAINACATSTAPAAAEGALYFGFTLIDPAQETRTENAYILVRDGRIAAIGAGTPPTDIRVAESHNLSGRYATPGFIDAHAHITAGPHRIEMRDGAPLLTIESDDAITRFAAHMALSSGVTTVRNPASDPEASAAYDAMIAAGGVGPEALHAGSAIEPPPFGGSAFAYPRTAEEWDAEAARQAALGMTYFKLYQSLNEEELAAGVAAAHAHGLQAIAHLNAVSWSRAIELGIDGLEHALPTSADLLEPGQREAYLTELGPDSKFMYRWFQRTDFDGPLMQNLFAQIASEDIALNLTLVVNELLYNIDDLDRVYPDTTRAFTHPESLAAILTFLRGSAAGWSEADFNSARETMPRVLEFARRLYESGAPMMIGTDSAGGTPFFAREMELHVEAGIPVWAVLRMATSDAADIMGLGARTGRIAVGYEADIAFLSADPSADVGAARNVYAVMSNGVFHRAEDLRAAARAGTP